MGLKPPKQYVESLRDGSVIYWDGERIHDITAHPRFRIPIAIIAAKYNYAANYHQTVRHLHDLAGGLTLMLPLESDLRNPESSVHIRKYLHTRPNVDVEQRRVRLCFASRE